MWKVDKIYKLQSFMALHISIWAGLEFCLVGLSSWKRPCGDGTDSSKPRSSYCVKSSLQKSRLIKLFTRARWSQSHTNNGFFKLVEALLQINSCFFSHSIKLYVAYCYQRCDCRVAITRQNVCVQQSYAGLPYLYNKNPENLCYEQKHMSVLVWIETIINRILIWL